VEGLIKVGLYYVPYICVVIVSDWIVNSLYLIFVGSWKELVYFMKKSGSFLHAQNLIYLIQYLKGHSSLTILS
jgi:hypothetical protein